MPTYARLLGIPGLRHNGTWLQPPAGLPSALLYYLAYKGSWVSREELSFLFWADAPEENARKNLRNLLVRIKEPAYTEGLEIERSRVRWQVETDVATFCEAIRQQDVQGFTELYEGELLAGFHLDDALEFSGWLERERQFLHCQWRESSLSLASSLESRGNYAQAAEILAALTEVDPLDEEGLCRLLKHLQQRGSTGNALGLFETFQQRLERDLGGVPKPATLALVAAIRQAHGPVPTLRKAPADARRPEQTIRFCTAKDGTRIAYATIGEGPPLVKAANFLSHLEYDWTSPLWRHWLEELTTHHQFIRYDERGSGLSDWEVQDVSFETWVNDLETVVTALGLGRFPLFALSQGGPVAIAYAVRHPEKVSHLILYGSYARGWLKRDLSEAQKEEEKIMLSLMRLGWGRDNPAFRQFFAAQLQPDATREQLNALDKLMRVSATPENAARLEQEMHTIDVTALAPQVKVPTLVIHPTQDAAVPFAEGKFLASLIPGATFVPLESRNHILLESEGAWQKFRLEFRKFFSVGMA